MQSTVGRRLLLVVAALLIFSSCFAGCANRKPAPTNEILTQKPLSSKKTTITVLVKYAFSINAFEEAVETKFPDIDIVQVGNYTRDMGIDEYYARLEHDDLPDIVMTWPLEVGEEFWEERLVDLSGMEFTSRYNLSMLNDISRDGKLYYLPGPSQVRGIIYNKTLFEEKGWEVPKDFEGFISLCKTIEDSGMRSLQLGLGNGEVLDTAFIGYGLSDCLSKPQDAQWLADYNNGENSFGDHFGPALDTFQRLIDEGILKKSDLDITYSDREKMLFSRQCAMVEDSVLLARQGSSITGTTDEFALMPFFNPGGDEADWARLYMVCYVGVNKHLEESKNKEKYETVMEVMDYISTPEGQEAMMGDTGAMFSSLTGVEPPNIPEIEDLIPALKRGRYATFPQLKNAQSALREGLAGMVRGDTTKEQVIEAVDAQNVSPPESEKSTLLGSATQDFTLVETGNFITDAMRAESGCEIALFLDNGKDGLYNGKGVSARFYSGEITVTDVERVLPDLKYGATGTLWKTSMSGADLKKTLEYSIVADGHSGWFYYFSGLKMEFNPAAVPGARIRKITMADGEEIDAETIYTVAIMEDSVPAECMQTCDKTDVTIAEIVVEAVKSVKSISPSEDGRFVIAQQ